MKYLKYFKTEAQYTAFKDTEEYILPNVSYVVENNVVNYNPYEVQETRVICTYNVTSTDKTQVCYSTNNFASMEVDGILLDSATTEYTFDTVGEHIIKFELYDSTTIIDTTFALCTNLTSITIPDSVTTIGQSAFVACTNLTDVHIGSGVTYIGVAAFGRCSGLTSMVIPNSVTTIGNQAFQECSGLTSINIPDSVITIGKQVFLKCTGLTSMVIPNSVTYIGEEAFKGCTNLTGELIIPDSVTTIDTNAFHSCIGLTSVYIGSGVTSFGRVVFLGCEGLTSIVVSKGNAKYDSRENCNCIIETITNTLIIGCNNSFIPDSVTTIGDSAFSYCEGLTGELIIPDSVTTIEGYAFYYCKGLTSIVIPNSVTAIGYGTFNSCTDLTSVHIGSGVTSINVQAFNGCSRLNEITCLAPTAPSIIKNTFYNIKSDGILKVPTGSDYSSWMSTDDYYLGKYNWTIEYI